jgi:ABC-type transport system involved in cytochrome bd biosynthesis fused ATPase/permease subunit
MTLQTLSRRGKFTWGISVFFGVVASILEVASAAAFSLLSSSVFGGRKSNFGILAESLPFIITQTVLISILGVIFTGKLVIQWIELNLKTKSAEEFFISIFRRRVSLSREEIEKSDSPVANLANRMHILTHNIYYPLGLIISELLILIFLVPFVFVISPKASLLVFGTTLILSIPALGIFRKQITRLNAERMQVDSLVDYTTYSDFRTYYDQGSFPSNTNKLTNQIHKSSELDRKIVKLGSYSRLTIEFSFIISVILTFSFINELVPREARIQFFAILAYSFFRVIPAFTRIISARNQIASFQSEFLNLMDYNLAPDWNEETIARTSFHNSLLISFQRKKSAESPLEMRFSPGEFVAIKGETGIGKTTLLKSVGGLTVGEFSLEVDGKRLASLKEWRPNSTLVSQNPFLRGDTLLEMVTGEKSANDVEASLYEESIKISGLNHWLEQRPGSISNEHISGGERKQIALARAIYLKPEILLLDEVTAGMDSELANRIIRNLLVCARFKLILMATHDSILENEFSQIIYL